MALALPINEILKWLSSLFSSSGLWRCLVALTLPVCDKNSNKVEVKFNEHTKEHSSYAKNYTLLYIDVTSDINDDGVQVMYICYISWLGWTGYESAVGTCVVFVLSCFTTGCDWKWCVVEGEYSVTLLSCCVLGWEFVHETLQWLSSLFRGCGLRTLPCGFATPSLWQKLEQGGSS